MKGTLGSKRESLRKPTATFSIVQLGVPSQPLFVIIKILKDSKLVLLQVQERATEHCMPGKEFPVWPYRL